MQRVQIWYEKIALSTRIPTLRTITKPFSSLATLKHIALAELKGFLSWIDDFSTFLRLTESELEKANDGRGILGKKTPVKNYSILLQKKPTEQIVPERSVLAWEQEGADIA